MRVRHGLVAVVLFAACANLRSTSSANAVVPQVGERAPRTLSVYSVHRGGDLCSGSVKVRGIEYNFDVECGKTTIVYVQTLDLAFVTTNGLKIGARLRDAINAGGRVTPTGECGVILPSGWIARPDPGVDTRGPVRVPCEDLLDARIAYFDTPFIGSGA